MIARTGAGCGIWTGDAMSSTSCDIPLHCTDPSLSNQCRSPWWRRYCLSVFPLLMQAKMVPGFSEVSFSIYCSVAN